KFIHTWLRFGEIMRGSLSARRDLILVSHALRHLPRMAQALNQSSDAADYVRTQRNNAGEQS
ncbi:hypothetical protein ACWGW2_04345, partial [Klebsiella pneumoniae]